MNKKIKLLDQLKNCDNCIVLGDEFCLNDHKKVCKRYIPSNLILLSLIEDLYKKINRDINNK